MFFRKNKKELGIIYSDGYTLFKEGDKSEKLWVILEGEVDLYKKGNYLTTLSIDDLLGELSIFGRKIHKVTAIAKNNARLISLDSERFKQNINRDPSLALKILQQLAKRLN